VKIKFRRLTTILLSCSLLSSLLLGGVCPALAQGTLEKSEINLVNEDDGGKSNKPKDSRGENSGSGNSGSGKSGGSGGENSGSGGNSGSEGGKSGNNGSGKSGDSGNGRSGGDEKFAYLIDESKELKINSNNLHHVFHNPTHDHHLEGFVASCGGDEGAAYKKLTEAAEKYIKENGFSRKFLDVDFSGNGGVPLDVGGFKVTIRGNLVGDRFRLGTAFIEK
jgi:hypothetical protein